MSKGQIFGYRRVSSVDQNLDRQDLGDCDKFFEEKISGSIRERPELDRLIEFSREDDTVVVYSIDRLGRNARDLLNIIHELNQKYVTVKFLKEGLVFDPKSENEYHELQFTMLSAFADFERKIIRRRQAEGIEKAKAKGRFKGGKVQKDHDRIADLLETTNITVSQIARENNCTRGTVYNVLKERFPGTSLAELRLRCKQREKPVF